MRIDSTGGAGPLGSRIRESSVARALVRQSGGGARVLRRGVDAARPGVAFAPEGHPQIEAAFFNGRGMFVWESGFGAFNLWPAGDREL